MAPDIFRVLVQSELSNLPVTCTQMIAVMDFVSRPCVLGFEDTYHNINCLVWAAVIFRNTDLVIKIWHLDHPTCSCLNCVLSSTCTVKILKIRTPEKFAVITLKFNQDGFTVQ